MIGLLRIPNNECNINPYPLFSLSFQNKIYFTTCSYCSVGSYKSQQFSYHLKPILCLLLVIQPFLHDPFLHIRGFLSESKVVNDFPPCFHTTFKGPTAAEHQIYLHRLKYLPGSAIPKPQTSYVHSSIWINAYKCDKS